MSEADASKAIAVRFIKDEPSETDFFGPHSRVANAVAQLIGEDNGINVIGLLGSWGSGKSTVVSQIKKKIGATTEHIHFFNYDAWLYQSDPVRRSFLEALIQDLVLNSLSDESQWQERLADLAGRSEETVTTTTRKLSKTGKWIVGSLGLVPIGTVFLGRALDPKNLENASWMISVGIGLTLAPIIMAALFYICWRPWRESWFLGLFKKDFWTRHRRPYTKQSIFALLTNQSVEKSEKKTKISPEPSVTEFRTVFRDVLKTLRAKRERLVIVIDNLDRLAEDEAMELWATIRSLFLGSELQGSARLELTQPTIILPIDESSVQRIFRRTDQEETKELAQSFMDKTFDVAFHINSPVMSDWRDFFKEKLQDAFGSAATDERVYWATKFVEDHASLTSPPKPITPRSLIKLVNAVGVLVKQWEDGSINFLSMAFFALHRVKISANPSEFLDEKWPNADAAINDWKRDVVALHYGVPREKAFQALLQEPLRLAIAASDETEFGRLANVVGFASVVEEVVSSLPTVAGSLAPQPSFVSNAALLVSKSASRDELWAKRAMSSLASSWVDCGPFDSFRMDFGEIVKVLAPFASGPQFLTSAAAQLGASVSKSTMSQEVAKHTVSALHSMRAAAQSAERASPVVLITSEPDELFILLKEVPIHLRSMLRTDKSANDLISVLTEWLEDEDEAERVAGGARALASTLTIGFKDKSKANWDSLAESARGIIADNELSYSGTGPSIDLLGILFEKCPDAKTYVTQLFDQGHLTSRLNEADNEENGPRLADISALMLLKGADFAGPNSKDWASIIDGDEAFVKNFVNALTWYTWQNPTEFLYQCLKTRPSLKPVLIEAIKNDISTNNAAGITPKLLLENIENLNILIGTELLNTAITRNVERTNFWSSFDGLKSGSPYDSAVEALANVEAIDREKLVKSVKDRLTGHDAASWSDAIEEDISPYNLVELYGNTLGQSDTLGDGLKSALSDAVPDLPQWTDGQVQRWFYLAKFISKDARVTQYKNLRDKIQSGVTFRDLPSFVRTGGGDFLTEAKFEDSGDRTTRHLIIPLLTSELGLSYLAENVDVFARCLAASDAETKNAVREALNSAEANLAEDERADFNRVNGAFDISISKPKAPRKQK